MKIVIAGYGVEGQANYRYFSALPGAEVTIIDQNESPDKPLPNGVKAILGEDAFSRLNGYDMVVRSAGVAPYKIVTDGKVWSATNEFFAKSTAPIIGITGSKGKGTTASLVAAILKEAGQNVWLVGNIGQPALEILQKLQPSDIVVYELSSFQLWDIKKSPATAVVLYIEQEHLDVHRSMQEYITAKANIAKFQSPDDLLIYNNHNTYAQQIAKESPASKIAFPSDNSAHISGDNFYYADQKICSTDALQLIGQHNQENALAAIDAVWKYVDDPSVIEKGLASFKGLPHRLAFVRKVADVSYYDDSIATTPGAAIAALRSFVAPKIIILGGSSKGADFSELGHELLKHDVQAIIIGESARDIAAAVDAVGFRNYTIMSPTTMQEVVEAAHRMARPGWVVLLSPSAASFDMFKDYADRGNQFIAAVEDLRPTD